LKSQKQKENVSVYRLNFEIFLRRINDTWILNNLSLAILNSKYNEIINQLTKNNTNAGHNKINDLYAGK
jgi:hypothetical protein